jgi:methionine biosynthesis protein MetW
VILGQTLQATREPHHVLKNLVRIGKRAVISFPNFGYWRVRASLMFVGKMPQTETLSYHWYDTPNIHFCTITDFVDLCGSLGIKIENGIALDRVGRTREIGRNGMFFSNLRGEQAIFLLKKS